MPNIEPDSADRLLSTKLPHMNVTPEIGEHTYHVKPPEPGQTNMELRNEAIASLVQADMQLQSD